MNDDRLKAIQADVDLMSRTLGETVPEPTAAPATQHVATDPPGTTAPMTESVATSAPATVAPATESPSDRETALLERIAALEAKADGPKTEVPATRAPATYAPLSDEDFMADVDLDEIARDPLAFNALLNKVFRKGIEVSRADADNVRNSLVSLMPEEISRNMDTISTVKSLANQFYKDNPDLRAYGQTVKTTFDEEVRKDANRSYDDIFKEVAVITRRKLGIKPGAKKQSGPPNLPRKSGNQRQVPNQPNANPLASELDAMDEALKNY